MAKPWVGHISFDGNTYACGLKKRFAETPPENRVMCYTCAIVTLEKYNSLVKILEEN